MRNKSIMFCNVMASVLTWVVIVLLMCCFYPADEHNRVNFPPPVPVVCSFLLITCLLSMIFLINLFKFIGLSYAEWHREKLMKEYYEQYDIKM